MNRWSLYLRRQWLTLVLTAVCGLLAVDFFTGPLGLRDLVVLRERRSQLEAAHKELLKSNAALKLKLSRLHDDDRYLERRIREQLGYVRPDELVYRFATEDSSQGSARDLSDDHRGRSLDRGPIVRPRDRRREFLDRRKFFTTAFLQ